MGLRKVTRFALPNASSVLRLNSNRQSSTCCRTRWDRVAHILEEEDDTMNAEDRFQAILRHPAYRTDWRVPLRRLYDLIRSGKSPADVGVTLPPDMFTGWVITQYESFLSNWGVRRAVQLEDRKEVNTILRELREGNTIITRI